MRKITLIAAILGCAGAAVGQDSVALTGGLVGDALDATNAGDQCRNYVVDLSPVQTSWGTTFGVAPVLKGTRQDANFFTGFVSANAISPDLLTNVPAASGGYVFWENSPGSGINLEFNNGPTDIIEPSGMTSQFSLGFTEFGGTYSGSVGAVVNYLPGNATRLLVTRRQLAGNVVTHGGPDSAQFGGLSTDANGNFYLRADDFNVTAGNAITGNNIFRVRLLARTCGQTNLIAVPIGDPGATDGLVTSSGTTYIPANNVPASIAGGAGLVAVPNFNTEYVYGPMAVTATTSHMSGAVAGLRGSIGTTNRFAMGGGVTSMGMLAQDANFDATMLNLWSAAANGSVVAGTPVAFSVPASVTDNWDGHTTNFVFGGANGAQFRHHASQAAFRGGVGQVALGADQGGTAMAAATISEFGQDNDASNQLLVASFDPSNPAGTVSWSVAAYIDFAAPSPGGGSGGGKAITDGAGTNIGQLSPLINVTGGSPLGPSISNPAFDSVGNIWFLSAVELFDRIGPDVSDFDSALIRGVKDPGGADSWELELVLELGSTIQGLNSGLPYQIQFLNIADSNSVSSATMCSTAVAENAWNNTPIAGLDTADPITNGGVVISTDIVYDVDLDGDYDDPTSSNGDPTSLDESYQVLLYVGHFSQGDPCDAIDFIDDDLINLADVLEFINLFSAGDPGADVNGDGFTNLQDVLDFITLFQSCV